MSLPGKILTSNVENKDDFSVPKLFTKSNKNQVIHDLIGFNKFVLFNNKTLRELIAEDIANSRQFQSYLRQEYKGSVSAKDFLEKEIKKNNPNYTNDPSDNSQYRKKLVLELMDLQQKRQFPNNFSQEEKSTETTTSTYNPDPKLEINLQPILKMIYYYLNSPKHQGTDTNTVNLYEMLIRKNLLVDIPKEEQDQLLNIFFEYAHQGGLLKSAEMKLNEGIDRRYYLIVPDLQHPLQFISHTTITNDNVKNYEIEYIEDCPVVIMSQNDVENSIETMEKLQSLKQNLTSKPLDQKNIDGISHVKFNMNLNGIKQTYQQFDSVTEKANAYYEQNNLMEYALLYLTDRHTSQDSRDKAAEIMRLFPEIVNIEPIKKGSTYDGDKILRYLGDRYFKPTENTQGVGILIVNIGKNALQNQDQTRFINTIKLLYRMGDADGAKEILQPYIDKISENKKEHPKILMEIIQNESSIISKRNITDAYKFLIKLDLKNQPQAPSNMAPRNS